MCDVLLQSECLEHQTACRVMGGVELWGLWSSGGCGVMGGCGVVGGVELWGLWSSGGCGVMGGCGVVGGVELWGAVE